METPPPPTTPLSPWDARISVFAKLAGVTLEQVNEALKPLVGEPGDGALVVLSDPNAVLDNPII